MRTVIALLMVLMLLVPVAGCRRGDVEVSLVVEGQPAPHEGYNVGPELYVNEGDPVPVTGAVIWIKGTEPNVLFGE